MGDWCIWFETFVNGKKIGAGVWIQTYKYKGNAVRAAKKRFDEPRIRYDGSTLTHKWVVSKTNPFQEENVIYV